MPTYAYACRDCGDDLEVVQSFTDDPLTECPNCGGQLKKKFHAVGIAFKGSGFYKNDSRGSSKRSDSKPSESSSSSSTDKGSTDKASTDKGSSDKSSSGSSSSNKGSGKSAAAASA
jgi:putative FmdB family regulatory protein